jgi:UDP-N-acetylmuramyl pentapeptide synthase
VKARRAGFSELVRTRPGRLELRGRYTSWIWGALIPVARVYRATAARRPRIVAVAGSVGKTTTMRAVSAALGLPVSRQALLNANSAPAVARGMLRVRPWQKRAVFEVAIDRPGQMSRHSTLIRPDVVVVTAVASDHWRSFETLEATREEKADIVRRLPPSATAVLNSDDPNVRWMAGQTRARVILVGAATDAELRASEIELDWPNGMRFNLHLREQVRPVATQLLGRHMIFPVLAALAVADVEGVSVDDAIAALASLAPTPGRMQIMAVANGAFVVRDEFKASEDSFVEALDTFAEIPAGRRIVVLGDIAEERSKDSYRAVGRQAGRFVDRMILVGNKYQAYRAGATAGGLDRSRITRVRSAHEALDLLREELQEGDVVLTKGRWQQALGRIGLSLAGREVRCVADPCPFKRMLCDVCPFLEQPFNGLAS